MEVHGSFPTGDPNEPIDELEFELGGHTSGTAPLEPGTMNDDVEHEPDGGTVEWDISCYPRPTIGSGSDGADEIGT